MATDKDIIVAIELGSSSIRGIAGKKNVDGTLHILDIVERKSKNCIRKGVIYNIDKTTQILKSIFIQLREDLNVYVNKAYVGIAGQSMGTMRNSVSKQMPERAVITAEIIDSLLDSNSNVNYPNKDILDVIPQEYRIGTNFISEPIGIVSNQIEAKFLNIVAHSSIKENILKCFEAAGIEIIDLIISPMALADNILTDNEKRTGCALVDCGAETTTVSIFKGNILRYMSVIPLGGNNVTLDICSKQLEEDEAEELKIKFGTAFADTTKEISRHIPLSYDPSVTLAEEELQEITEARMEEIIANIWEQIQQSGYADRLNSGIVITGGAANIQNIEKAISYRTKSDKVKVAKNLHTIIIPGQFEEHIQQFNTNTLISLLACSNEDCTGEDPIEKEQKRREEEERIRQEEEKERQIQEQKLNEDTSAKNPEKEESTNKDDSGNKDNEENKNGFMKNLKNKLIKITRIFTEPEE